MEEVGGSNPPQPIRFALLTQVDGLVVSTTYTRGGNTMANRFETDVLGDHVSLNFDGPWAGYWFALVRVLLGYWFLHSGLSKLLFGFSAAGYLKYDSQGAITQPIMQPFATGAGLAFVNVAIPFGEFFIGLGLVFGVLVRLASFFGGVLMFMFYFTNHAWAHGMAGTSELFALLLFVTLAVFGAGRVWRIDEYLVEIEWVKDNRWAAYLLR